MTQRLTPAKIVRTLELNKAELKRFSVKRIGLFGSFLKRTDNKTSDIDFIVTLKEPTFDNYMELKFLLEKIFQKKIDLVTEKSLKPQLKYVTEEALYAKAI